METLHLQSLLLVGELRPGDVVGFTFFTGYMAMFAASVFFFLERSQVEGHWKTSLTISGLITLIASVHYYYMRDQYLATGQSPTEFRYIDWTLTVPLMCVEFYMIIKPFGGKVSTMWKLIAYSVFVLVGWAIYPIGFMLLPGNLLAGLKFNIDLVYNVADAVNKIGFGLVVYSAAIANSNALHEAPFQRATPAERREPSRI